MRGFAFVGGEGPDLAYGLDLAEGDLLVAADSGLTSVAARGLRADWIVGDMDSLSDRSLLNEYPSDRVRAFPTDKDDSDTEIALRLLAELGCRERIIVGGGGGRLDHLLAIAALFEREEAPDRWITRNEDCFLVDPSRARGTLRAQLPAGAIVSVFPIGFGPWISRSRGLKWPLDGLCWERGRFGLSNVALRGECEIGSDSGRFLAVLPIGACGRVS